VQLGELLVLHLNGLGHGLLDAHRVCVLFARLTLERTIGAARGADVGQVQVAINVEHDAVAVSLCSHVMCQSAQPREVVGSVQSLAVSTGKPFPGVHLLFKLTLHAHVHVR
jgi:hypothetical protein